MNGDEFGGITSGGNISDYYSNQRAKHKGRQPSGVSGGGPTGNEPYLPEGDPGWGTDFTPDPGIPDAMSSFMGSGVMPGADEDPFAGDATEIYGGSNIGGRGGRDFPLDEIKYDQPENWQNFFDWAHEGAPTGQVGYGPQYNELYGAYSDPSQARYDSPAFPWHIEPTQANQAFEWRGTQGNPNPLIGVPQHELRQGINPQDRGQYDWATEGLEDLQSAYDVYRGSGGQGATNVDHFKQNPWDAYQNAWNQMGSRWDTARQGAIDQKDLDDQAAAQQRLIDACVASGGTWNGVSCDPKQEPTDQELCAQKAGWHWDGSTCVKDDDETIINTGGDITTNNLPFTPTNTGTTTPDTRTGRTNQIASPHTYDERVPGSAAAVDTGNLPGEADVNQVQSQIGGLQQMGTDPMSRLMAATAAGLMTTGGVAPTPMASELEGALVDSIANRGTGAEFETEYGQGVADEYQRLIETGGALPLDRQQRAMELENIRSPLDDLRRAQLAQGGAAMADRGLTGQGPEYDFRERTEKKLAPMYAQAGRDLELAQRQEENVRYRDALTGAQQMGTEQRRRGQEEYLTAMQQATGLSAAQSQNLVNTLATTGDLQENMQDFALDLLRENVGWNKFLHETGIMRDTIEELVTRNRIGDLVNILNSYTDLGGILGTGMVDYGYKVRQEDKK